MRALLLFPAFLAPAHPAAPATMGGVVSAADAGGAIEARAATWDEVLAAGLDPRWLLPDAPRDPGQPDLVREAEALLARDLATGEREPVRRLGDLVRALEPLSGRERDTRLAGFLDARPHLAGVRPALEELLRDGRFDAGWDPGDDARDDGFWMGAPWDLRTERRAPWDDLKGSEKAFQGATLIRADLGDLLAAENDFCAYDDHVGEEYERIRPRALLRGEDPEGRPFAAVLAEFERDLPFPFGSYEYALWTLYRLDAGGRLIAYASSRSSDFHWLAGHDVHLPVRASDGELVALLVVRQFGFDLAGVPDRDANRREALREGLGNFKRDAEARARARGGPLRELDGLPEFELRMP